MLNYWKIMCGKHYSSKRNTEKKLGRVKAENRKLKEDICFLEQENNNLKLQIELHLSNPF